MPVKVTMPVFRNDDMPVNYDSEIAVLSGVDPAPLSHPFAFTFFHPHTQTSRPLDPTTSSIAFPAFGRGGAEQVRNGPSQQMKNSYESSREE